jgi:hypothetical protein
MGLPRPFIFWMHYSNHTVLLLIFCIYTNNLYTLLFPWMYFARPNRCILGFDCETFGCKRYINPSAYLQHIYNTFCSFCRRSKPLHSFMRRSCIKGVSELYSCLHLQVFVSRPWCPQPKHWLVQSSYLKYPHSLHIGPFTHTHQHFLLLWQCSFNHLCCQGNQVNFSRALITSRFDWQSSQQSFQR